MNKNQTRNKKLKFFSTNDQPIIGTTQSQIPVVDILENIALFRDGGAALILETTSLNFGLLSEREQEAVVAAFAALINSLSFQTQILVKTQKKDVSIYLNFLDESIAKSKNEKLQKLMIGYRNFIGETISKKNVLGKRFFLIIPFSPLELGLSPKSFNPFSKKESGALPFTKDYIVKKALITLIPKRDHLIRQAQRLGLKLRQLTDQEILMLYYNTYNPDTSQYKIRKEEDQNEIAVPEKPNPVQNPTHS